MHWRFHDLKYQRSGIILTGAVKSFPGSKTSFMEHCIEATFKQKPDTIMIHVETNVRKSVDTASQISNKIVNLAKKCYKFGSRFIISDIVKRGDEL